MQASSTLWRFHFGGVGIIKATSIASSAYISSKLSCVELEASLLPDNLPLPHSPGDLDHAFSNWKACSDTDVLPSSTRQRDWSLAVFQNTQQSLLSSTVDAQDEDRLLAIVHKRSQVHGWRPYQFPPWGFISVIMT